MIVDMFCPNIYCVPKVFQAFCTQIYIKWTKHNNKIISNENKNIDMTKTKISRKVFKYKILGWMPSILYLKTQKHLSDKNFAFQFKKCIFYNKI